MSHFQNSNDIEIQDLSSLRNCRTELPNILYELDLTGLQIAVYNVLKRTAGDSGRSFKGKERIAKESGVSKPTVIKILRSFEKPFEKLGGKPLIIRKKQKNKFGGDAPDLIAIVDIWSDNFDFFLKAATKKESENPKKSKNFKNTQTVNLQLNSNNLLRGKSLSGGGVKTFPGGGKNINPKKNKDKKEPNIRKVNDKGSMPFQKKYSKKPNPKNQNFSKTSKANLKKETNFQKGFVPNLKLERFLKKDQIPYFRELIQKESATGDKVEPSAASYWIRRWGTVRVKEAETLYWQQAGKAKKGKAPMPQNMGRYVRHALNVDLKPQTSNETQNLGLAKILSKNHPKMVVTQKYASIPELGIDLQYNLPASLFEKTLKEKLDLLTEYYPTKQNVSAHDGAVLRL